MIEVDGYTLDDELGRGGFGTVFRATDHVHGRPVALKVLGRLDDEGARRRFDRERRAMGTLSGHPNIAVVYNSGFTADERPFIAMELLTGGSLADMLDAGGPLGADEAVAIGVQLCDALGHAHAGGVLHLDMKPENVLLSEFGAVKVVDFGIAALVDDKRSTTIFATPAFADPRVLDGQPGTDASDVYGLAATLYNLIVGVAPYATESGGLSTFHKIANDPVPRIERSGIPAALCDAIHRAMSKDPADRPTMPELRQALISSTGAAAAPAAPATTPGVPATVGVAPPATGTTHAPGIPATASAAVHAGGASEQPDGPEPESPTPRGRSNTAGIALLFLAGLLLIGFVVIAFTGGDDDGDEPAAGPGTALDIAEDPEPDTTTRPSVDDQPEQGTGSEAVIETTTPAATTVVETTLPPRRPPQDGPQASNPRFSIQTTNGLPDPEVFVVPAGAPRLCLTWSYLDLPINAPFQVGWSLDGTPDPTSVSTGTNQGGVSGDFFGCVENDGGLNAGVLEATWTVGGQPVFSHATFVGGDRRPVTIGIQNDRSDAVCDVFWAPIGSSTLGLPANPVPVPSGQRFETTLPTGRYRTVVRNCAGAVVFDEAMTEFVDDATLTVVD